MGLKLSQDCKIIINSLKYFPGDTTTDFLQGLYLILDFTDGSIRWSTLKYGLALILTNWIPLIVIVLHVGFSSENNIFKHCRTLPGIFGLLLMAVMFPIVPTLMYALLILSPRSSSRDRKHYKLLESRAHEVKSICGAIESPIQLGILRIQILFFFNKRNFFSFVVVSDDPRHPHASLE